MSGHFSLTGFLFRTLSACTALSKRRRVDRCEITRLPEIYFWSKDVQYLCENDLSGKIRLFIDHNKTLTAAKKQHLLVFAFAVAENQKETKRKPTWKSQVSKNKKKPTVANSAIFYPKSSITPENQVTMYWVKRDNRTTLVVIGLPTLLKQPTKLKKDF